MGERAHAPSRRSCQRADARQRRRVLPFHPALTLSCVWARVCPLGVQALKYERASRTSTSRQDLHATVAGLRRRTRWRPAGDPFIKNIGFQTCVEERVKKRSSSSVRGLAARRAAGGSRPQLVRVASGGAGIPFDGRLQQRPGICATPGAVRTRVRVKGSAPLCARFSAARAKGCTNECAASVAWVVCACWRVSHSVPCVAFFRVACVAACRRCVCHTRRCVPSRCTRGSLNRARVSRV